MGMPSFYSAKYMSPINTSPDFSASLLRVRLLCLAVIPSPYLTPQPWMIIPDHSSLDPSDCLLMLQDICSAVFYWCPRESILFLYLLFALWLSLLPLLQMLFNTDLTPSSSYSAVWLLFVATAHYQSLRR